VTKRPFTALIVAAFALSACVGAEITTPPVSVTPTVKANAVGLDVYARDRQRGNPVPRFRGQKTVQIRAFGKGSTEGQTELSGIRCQVDAGVYKATIITPANLNVPDYGPSSPAIFVRCVEGERSGSATVNAYNATNAGRQSGAAGGGILGAIVVGAVAASMRDDNLDDFQYPAIRVTLK
jgi:hypothetical protein